jgi:hypothetical protein
MHGRSWLAAAAGRVPADWRQDFVYEYAWEQDFPYTSSIVGLRNQTHSLMSYPGTWDIPELYDVAKDPEQAQNLLAGARIGSRMRGRYSYHIEDPATKKLVEAMQDRPASSLLHTGGDPRLAGKVGETTHSRCRSTHAPTLALGLNCSGCILTIPESQLTGRMRCSCEVGATIPDALGWEPIFRSRLSHRLQTLIEVRAELIDCERSPRLNAGRRTNIWSTTEEH